MTSLDSRSWLVWGAACTVPLLMSRHPAIVLQLMLIVLTVRLVSLPSSALRWGWFIRVAALFAVIGVLFNALTVRTGNQVAWEIPGLGLSITWNAIIYGLVSGLAMITLVLTGVTTAAGLNWIALTRVLPRRLAPLAVSGSVAWSFVPGASQALAEIREAQSARGHEIRSGRDVLPIVVPLLDGSLNRALTMSEALEARGFGASLHASQDDRKQNPLWGSLLLLGLLVMAYAISLGDGRLLWVSAITCGVGSVGVLRAPQFGGRTTRYREHPLRRPDAVVMAASIGALIGFLWVASRDVGAVTFNPYPNLDLPPVDAFLLLPLSLLLAPALYPFRTRSS